jgi:hypothetical protein
MQTIIIHVEGGLVQAVYTDKGRKEATRVQVIDLDLSDFSTPEEEADHEKNKEAIDTISHTMTAIY